MSIEGFKKYTRRSRNSAGDMNRLRGQVENLSRARPPSGAGLYVRGRAGSPLVSLARPEPIWVQVTGPLASFDRLEAYTQVTDDGGVWTPPADALEGSASFPAYVPPGWPDPAEGDVVLALPSAGEDGLILLTPAAPGEGTSGDPVTVNYAYYTFNFVTNVAMTIATGATLIVSGGGIWLFDVDVTFATEVNFDHIVCFDGVTVTLSATALDNYDPDGKPWLRLITPGAGTAYYLSGVLADPLDDGCQVLLTNVGPGDLVILHQSTLSATANRIVVPGDADLTLTPDSSGLLARDVDEQRWRLIYPLPARGVQVITLATTPAHDLAWTFGLPQLWLRLAASAPSVLDGLLAPPPAQKGGELILTNTGPAKVDLLDQGDPANGSSGSNRIAVPGGATLSLLAGESTRLGYDGTLSAWRVLDRAPAAGTAPAYSGASVYHSTTQVFAGTGTQVYTVLFNSETYDTDGYHSTASNTGRLTVPSTGKYSIGACVSVAGANLTAGCDIELSLRVNGSLTIADSAAPPVTTLAVSSFAASLNVQTDYPLAAGDYVEVRLSTDKGPLSALQTTYSPRFWITRLGT
jgi:hypothetical protein